MQVHQGRRCHSVLTAMLCCAPADRRYRDREPAPGMSVFNFEKTEEVRCAVLCCAVS